MHTDPPYIYTQARPSVSVVLDPATALMGGRKQIDCTHCRPLLLVWSLMTEKKKGRRAFSLHADAAMRCASSGRDALAHAAAAVRRATVGSACETARVDAALQLGVLSLFVSLRQ